MAKKLEIDVSSEILIRAKPFTVGSQEIYASLRKITLGTYVATWQPDYYNGDETKYTKRFNATGLVMFPQVNRGLFSLREIDYNRNNIVMEEVKFDTPLSIRSYINSVLGV
jgi:hypothetical protein